MKAEHILYSVLIFSVMFLGGFYAIADVSSFYNSGMSFDSYLSENDATESIKNMSDYMREDLESTENEDVTQVSLFSKAIKAFKRIFETYTISSKILTGIANQLEMPNYLPSAILSAISILIVISLVYIFIGWWRG